VVRDEDLPHFQRDLAVRPVAPIADTVYVLVRDPLRPEEAFGRPETLLRLLLLLQELGADRVAVVLELGVRRVLAARAADEPELRELGLFVVAVADGALVAAVDLALEGRGDDARRDLADDRQVL